MTSDRPAAVRAIVPPLYFVGALLVALPLADLAINVWPLQPGDFRWRFGVVGLLAGYLLTPLLGVALLAGAAELAAAGSPSPTGRRVVGWLNVASGLLLLVLTALFALDLLQLRPALRPEALRSFDIANGRAIVKLALGAIALLWLGVAGARRGAPAAGAARRAHPAPARVAA